MADDDPFGLSPEALAAYIAGLGEPYKPYAENIRNRGMFGEFLLDRVGDMDEFSKALAKMDITTVRFDHARCL